MQQVEWAGGVGGVQFRSDLLHFSALDSAASAQTEVGQDVPKVSPDPARACFVVDTAVASSPVILLSYNRTSLGF